MNGVVSRLHELPGGQFGPDDQVLALTFDDGPGAATMPIAETLARLDVSATFFVLGSEAERAPEQLKAVADAGHRIGGHSWSHTLADEMSDAQLIDESMRTAAVIREVTGQEAEYVRPPYRPQDGKRYASLLEEFGFTIVIWSIDPRDWETDDPVEVVRGVLDACHPGGIAILHDGGANKTATVDALPMIVHGARLAGYQFVGL